MGFNYTTGKFQFDVYHQYTMWNTIWVIDFSPFTRNSTFGSYGIGATACENHNM